MISPSMDTILPSNAEVMTVADVGCGRRILIFSKYKKIPPPPPPRSLTP